MRALDDFAQVLLNQSAENHGPHALRLGRGVDATAGFLRLVNSGDKWQSDLPECLRVELCQQAMPHRLGGHAGLIGYKKNRSSFHAGPIRLVVALAPRV